MLKIYCQQDPLWGTQKLGQSSLTIAKFGCTTCSYCMLLSYFGIIKDPVEVQKYIKYTPDGLIIWQSISLPVTFVERIYTKDDKKIQAALKDPDMGVLLEVNKCHWVLATGKVPLVDTYLIADPWKGDRATTLRYKNNITGAAIFRKI